MAPQALHKSSAAERVAPQRRRRELCKPGASVKRSGTRRPWLQKIILKRALKVRNINVNYFALSELHDHLCSYQGRRASRCSALAPGFHIPRRWRWCLTFIFRAAGAGARLHIPRRWRWCLAFIFRAVGAGAWLSYPAPLALAPGFYIPRLWRWHYSSLEDHIQATGIKEIFDLIPISDQPLKLT